MRQIYALDLQMRRPANWGLVRYLRCLLAHREWTAVTLPETAVGAQCAKCTRVYWWHDKSNQSSNEGPMVIRRYSHAEAMRLYSQTKVIRNTIGD